MMTKAKGMTPNSRGSTPKGTLRGVKKTPISKNNTPKFKVTPTGKVPLINGSTLKGNINKNTPKGAGNFQKSPKNQNNSPQKQNTPQNGQKKKSLNGKKSPNAQSTPKGEKNDSSGKSPELPQKLSEQQLKAKVAQLMEVGDNNDDSDDNEDINEGIEINEDISEEDSEDNDDADSETDDTGVKDILGNSLADYSDDDDVDFDEEDDEDESDDEDENDGDDDDEDEDEDEDDAVEVVNKGVKMFQGLTAATDEEDNDEGNQSGPGLKSLLGNSMADDDDDDEDFEEGDEDDEDDDISDEDDEDEDEYVGSPINEQNVGEDDSDEEDSEVEEDDAEESSNDDDDEESEKKPRLTQEEKDERAKKTLFIGNVPKETKKNTLKQLFRKFGMIESVRIRGIIPEDPKIPLKVAAIKKKYHAKMTTLNVFITFKERESAVKALAMNGQKLGDHFLRVNLAKSEERPDQKKAVFLGNLSFKVEENDIWTHFGECGKIVSVRVVRDRRTGAGKGFGYVNFDSTDGVTLALELNGSELQNREIRVKPCITPAPKDPEGKKRMWKQEGKRQHPKAKQGGGSPKKFKDEAGKSVAIATRNSQNAERRTEMKQKQKRSQGEQQRIKDGSPKKHTSPFQGQKADSKKPKFNKTDKKKKQMAAKLTARPKKSSDNKF